jgi:hypothetical protein
MEKYLSEEARKKYEGMDITTFVMDCLGALDKGITLGFFDTSGEKLYQARTTALDIFYIYLIINKGKMKGNECDCDSCKRKREQGDTSTSTLTDFLQVNSYYILFAKLANAIFEINILEEDFMNHYMNLAFKKDTPMEVKTKFLQSVVIGLTKYKLEQESMERLGDFIEEEMKGMSPQDLLTGGINNNCN